MERLYSGPQQAEEPEIQKIENRSNKDLLAELKSERVRSFLLRYTAKILSSLGEKASRVDTEDIVQEVLLGANLAISKGNFRGENTLEVYLKGIARRVIGKALRKPSLTKETLLAEDTSEMVAIPTAVPDARELATELEIVRQTRAYIDKLSPKQKQAVTLVGIEGLSHPEASRITGEREAITRNHYRQGLDKLRELHGLSKISKRTDTENDSTVYAAKKLKIPRTDLTNTMQMIESLPPKQQGAVKLYIQGQTNAQIGQALGISENTAKIRIDRAKKRLRQMNNQLE